MKVSPKAALSSNSCMRVLGKLEEFDPSLFFSLNDLEIDFIINMELSGHFTRGGDFVCGVLASSEDS